MDKYIGKRLDGKYEIHELIGVGGMAYGVRAGLLDSATYMPAIRRGWEAMRRAVHDDTGFVGYMQGTGSKPEDGGPVTYNSVPDFQDFGIGCWLWGAAEVHALAVSCGEGGTSAVGGARVSPGSDGAYYDLSGRRVDSPVHGRIYIRGGQKVAY